VVGTIITDRPPHRSVHALAAGKAIHVEGVFRSKVGFADFEDEYVALDLPHIPEPTRSEMTKELELRLQQLRMLLQAFHSE
jgi:hypothetical protein